MEHPGSFRESSVSLVKSVATSASRPTFAIHVTARTTIVRSLPPQTSLGEDSRLSRQQSSTPPQTHPQRLCDPDPARLRPCRFSRPLLSPEKPDNPVPAWAAYRNV